MNVLKEAHVDLSWVCQFLQWRLTQQRCGKREGAREGRSYNNNNNAGIIRDEDVWL